MKASKNLIIFLLLRLNLMVYDVLVTVIWTQAIRAGRPLLKRAVLKSMAFYPVTWFLKDATTFSTFDMI